MIDIRTAPYGALLLRVSMGVLFIAHALLNIIVFTMPGTVAFFESLGLPGALAWVTMIAELGGGVLLILGVGVRIVSLALVAILLGAAITAHGGNGWVFSNPGGGWEFPVWWAVICVVQALLGPGAHALMPARTART